MPLSRIRANVVSGGAGAGAILSAEIVASDLTDEVCFPGEQEATLTVKKKLAKNSMIALFSFLENIALIFNALNQFRLCKLTSSLNADSRQIGDSTKRNKLSQPAKTLGGIEE